MRTQNFNSEEINEKYIYRYVSLDKLVHFLSTESIYLTRSDRFEDNLEGISVDDIRQYLFYSSNPLEFLQSSKKITYSKEILNNQNKRELIKIQKRTLNRQRDRFISSWILGNVESFAMWDLYAPNGFCIRFEREKFLQLIKISVGKQEKLEKILGKVVFGKVRYFDFQEIPELTANEKDLYSSFLKHLSFKHENEYRLVGYGDGFSYDGLEFTLNGLKQDHFSVFASPRTTGLQFNMSSNILSKYNCPLQYSDLKVWLDFRSKEFNPIIETEHWKSIKEFPTYEVSSLGRVRNIKTRKYRMFLQNEHGHKLIGLNKGGIQKRFYMHRLVYQTFVGSIRAGVVSHKNGDMGDNRLSNLFLISKRESISRGKKGKSKSQYTGVNWYGSGGYWRAACEHNGEVVHLGRFKTDIDAAVAYDEFVIKNNIDTIRNFS